MAKEETLKRQVDEERRRATHLERELRDARDDLRAARSSLAKSERRVASHTKELDSAKISHRDAISRRVEILEARGEFDGEREVI